ncbi:hypothetical protein FHS85_000172 [Rhodoligotrophos appendicifer]|uniref:hypothetical protein n=1 Tax=Rhodoligotrophos appendicifer TaxID=987056 RepID=UPI001FE37D57|nr:hypothetical protein [Rhodoligotrophos appendicifer]
MRLVFGALFFCLAWGTLTSARAQPPVSYSDANSGVFLRYLNAPEPGDDITESPFLALSLDGGETHRAIMDTGSTGIVVAAHSIPDFDNLPSLGPGKLTYTSSGRVMNGQWVSTTATIADADGASIVTRPLPVLAVTEVTCLEDARDCTPDPDPRRVAMIGIGFAREGDRQGQSTPDKNPFLNPDVGDRTLHQGYVVTREGVHVGLTAANTGGGFAYSKLQRQETIEDWAAAPMCVDVDDTPAGCGTILVDTGVTRMFLGLAEGSAPPMGDGGRLADGTKLAFYVPEKADSVARYSFTLGEDGNPLAPRAVILTRPRAAAFVNTTVYFLNGFDYLFDAEAGYVAFRWTGHALGATGQ